MRSLSSALAGAALLALAGPTLAACGADNGGSDAPAAIGATAPAQRAQQPATVTLPGNDTVRLPAGWELIRQRTNQVAYPVQLLTATSYPVPEPVRRGRGCGPGPVLADKPPGGALVQIVEWTERPVQPDRSNFPPRPRPFRLPADAYANYECSGPSYNIPFRDGDRRFQAYVWLDPDRGDPGTRRQARALLDSLTLTTRAAGD